MAKKKASPRRSDRRDNRTARKTRKKAVRAGAKGNAQEMAKRVQQAFDEGYREGEIREVEYEKSDDGVGADQIFFQEMIVRSIRRHHGGGDPPDPEPPKATKETAVRHGYMVRAIQPTGPIRLANILSTFYKLKDEMCPNPAGKAIILGKVCNF